MRNIGVIFGGRSGEHEISLLSAASVIKAIDRKKFQVVLIGITKEGKWKRFDGNVDKIPTGEWEKTSIDFDINKISETIDFALPILHGPYGEDGTIQGLFEMLNIPYGGCGVLSSALAMDKVIAKQIFEKNEIPTCAYSWTYAEEVEKNLDEVVKKIESKLTYNMFVKPSNMGSSVGITKVKNRKELEAALKFAARFDRRIIIEEGINCREIETGVLGNYDPKIAAVGEIVAGNEFYDYTAKYSDDAGTVLSIPADIPKATYEKIRMYAKKAYEALDCAGFARVDFFIDKENGEVFINEINTIPGFTKYSMFPSLWKEAGLPFDELVERIVELGYERYNIKNNR